MTSRIIAACVAVTARYTWSGYDKTPLATVKKEIHDWVAWYAVTHIFVDGAATNDAAYYCNLAGYAISQGVTQFEINPGTNIGSAKYECAGTAAAGHVVINAYEGPGGSPFAAYVPPAWLARYPGDLAVTLATPGQTVAGMQADLSAARADGAAYFFEGTDTSYMTLPAFFGQEVSAVSGAARRP